MPAVLPCPRHAGHLRCSPRGPPAPFCAFIRFVLSVPAFSDSVCVPAARPGCVFAPLAARASCTPSAPFQRLRRRPFSDSVCVSTARPGSVFAPLAARALVHSVGALQQLRRRPLQRLRRRPLQRLLQRAHGTPRQLCTPLTYTLRFLPAEHLPRRLRCPARPPPFCDFVGPCRRSSVLRGPDPNVKYPYPIVFL